MPLMRTQPSIEGDNFPRTLPGSEVTGLVVPVALNSILVSAAAGAPVLTRNAQGDWYLTRTAAGAETLVFQAVVPLRKVSALGLGTKLTAVNAYYSVGVVVATSVNLAVVTTVYAQAAYGTAPTVAAYGGAIVDGSYDANHNTPVLRANVNEHLMTLTLPTPAYNNVAASLAAIELTAVLANTGVFRLRGIDCVYSQTLD